LAEPSQESDAALEESAAMVGRSELDVDSAWSHADTLMSTETFRTYRVKHRDQTCKNKGIWNVIVPKMNKLQKKYKSQCRKMQ